MKENDSLVMHLTHQLCQNRSENFWWCSKSFWNFILSNTSNDTTIIQNYINASCWIINFTDFISKIVKKLSPIFHEASRLNCSFLSYKKTISDVIQPSSNFRLKMFINPLSFYGFVVLVRKKEQIAFLCSIY